MCYSAWDFISEILERTGSKELNFTRERLDAVKGRVPMVIRDGDHYRLTTGIPESWPDIGEHVNADMTNGNDDESHWV